MRPADADLVARCRRGDVGAFEELYRQHAARLYNLAYRMLGNAEEAGFELEASSCSGSVRSDLPVVLDGFDSGSTGRRRNRNVVGTYGDGRALLEISTFSGDIVIAR